MKGDWNKILTALSQVTSLDDAVMESVRNIKIILINLQIEAAHIEVDTKKSNGIKPICQELNRIMDKLEDSGKDILSLRKEVEQSVENLTKYFNESEGHR